MTWRKRRTFRRRRSRRSYRRRSKRVSIGRWRSILPDCKKFKLKYVDYITHEATTTVSGSLLIGSYRANSMYDPEVALGGGQPAGFDQLCLQYNKFYVSGCSIKVSVMNSGVPAGGIFPNQIWVYPVSDANESAYQLSVVGLRSDADTAMPYLRKKWLPIRNQTTRPVVVKSYMKTTKIFGITGPMTLGQINQTALLPYWHPSTSDPTLSNIWYWNVHQVALGGTWLSECAIKVELTYYGIARGKAMQIDS